MLSSDDEWRKWWCCLCRLINLDEALIVPGQMFPTPYFGFISFYVLSYACVLLLCLFCFFLDSCILWITPAWPLLLFTLLLLCCTVWSLVHESYTVYSLLHDIVCLNCKNVVVQPCSQGKEQYVHIKVCN